MLQHCKPVLLLLSILMVVLALPPGAGASPDEVLVFFGTYTSAGSQGIYSYKFDSASGALSMAHVTGGIKNPSYLAVHPNHKYLYAVSEVVGSAGHPGGSLWAFKIEGSSGELTLLNHQSTGGDGPCFVSVDPSGKAALVANYDDGSLASLPIRDDGSLGAVASLIRHRGSGVDPKRQAGPHPHSVNFSPDNRFVIVADLGIDQLMFYRLNAARAKLKACSLPACQAHPGAGPRHMVFSRDGRFAYVANELSSSVGVYAFDSKKHSLTELQIIRTLPDPTVQNTVAEIQLLPSGEFLYCSNRGDDSLAVFTVDKETGRLSPSAYKKTQGRTPRGFSIDPDGNFLLVCNQASNNVVVFKIDRQSGRLLQIEEPLVIPEPACVIFLKPEARP
jgi:6-phosphogluconolactonase